jgi:hypothetical protein
MFFQPCTGMINKNIPKTLFNSHLVFFCSGLISFLISIHGIAQTVEVNTANGTIKDQSLKGFVVCLELDVKSVESGWSRYMKSMGKFETVEKQAMEGLNLVLPNISSDAVDFYSKITVSPRCVQVFMGALRAGSALELPEEQKEKIQKMLYDFALEQYRQDLIKQISEAERVVNLAVKAHDKRSNEGQSLRKRISRNKKEKIRLLQNLEENAKELSRLRADSTQNVSELETAMEEIRKVRQIAEEKKQKLSQVK